MVRLEKMVNLLQKRQGNIGQRSRLLSLPLADPKSLKSLTNIGTHPHMAGIK